MKQNFNKVTQNNENFKQNFMIYYYVEMIDLYENVYLVLLDVKRFVILLA